MKKLLIDIGKKSKKAINKRLSTKKKDEVLKDYRLLILKNKKLIKKVNNLDKDMKKIYIKGVTEFGKGGMNTKIEAAKICNLAGCNMIIANGLYLNPIQQIEKKNICTLFESRISKLHARKKWIISSISPKGTLVIDDGAKKALVSGKSLLAAGIVNLSGKFDKGDHIKILDTKNKEFARGLSSFSSEEINKIMGCQSNEIEKKNICTLFESKISKLHARKKWIISSVSPKGTLVIDDGAKKALVSGKSLLAAGIINLSGKFNKGDHIKILDTKNKEFARGLSSFSSEEINKIMGCHSNEIQKKLGYITKSEVVHKDDMVEV